MFLLNDAKDAAVTSGAGQWFVFPQKDPDNGKDVRFLVRAIPDGESREIYRRHFGRKREIKRDKHGNELSGYDSEAGLAHLVERASFVLVDCENFGVRVLDDEAAEFYTKQLGSPVPVGEAIALDGRLNDDIKERLFDKHTSLANWVLEKADTLALQIKEEDAEEGKG